MGLDRDPQLENMQKTRDLEFFVLNEMSSTNYSLQDSGICAEGEEERTLELEVMGDRKQNCLPDTGKPSLPDTTGLMYIGT